MAEAALPPIRRHTHEMYFIYLWGKQYRSCDHIFTDFLLDHMNLYVPLEEGSKLCNKDKMSIWGWFGEAERVVVLRI